MQNNFSAEAIKRPITMVLILFIVVIVYFSGPSVAFYATSLPSMQHNPGTKDINVPITFYKERYEAIGTIGASLLRLPPNADATDLSTFRNSPATFETVGATDYNCWATPYSATQPTIGSGEAYDNTSFYSYELDAYYAPGTPSGPFAAGGTFDGNFDIFAYGYMWDPWDINVEHGTAVGAAGTTRAPGDANFVYKFMDWSSDMGFSYNPDNTSVATINTAAAQFGYYGYGYNYAGKFTCIFHFRSVPEGIYLAVSPYINGLKVDLSGYNAGPGPLTPRGNTSGSLILIKDVNSSGPTDVNFYEPDGATKRISFTVPQNAISGATFITIDVNADNISPPSGANLEMGRSSRPPRFTFGSDAGTITLTTAATLRLFWTGILTAAQASAILSTMVMYQYDPSTQGWNRLSTSINQDLNQLSVSVTSFV